MSFSIDQDACRQSDAPFSAMPELQCVRKFTRLSQKNFCIDTHFYPLGSCTMKYNPRAVNRLANDAGFLSTHPLAVESQAQPYLSCIVELQQMLQQLTGMHQVSLAPMAGAQGEFAGVSMIRAYHQANGDEQRLDILVPDAAHGTNPASAVKCGMNVKQIPTRADGDIDLDALASLLGPNTAGIMLTNPSTLGVWERKILEIQRLVHQAGGLLYYDGANLNAMLGRFSPGDMGFDVMHLNLHKTFATPHGGGGPGAGPVAANARLAPYLPIPYVIKQGEQLGWQTQQQAPLSMGSLSAWMGNAGVLLRAYLYIRLLGREGVARVADYACLNARYLQHCLQDVGYTLAFPDRCASHEFIVTLKPLTDRYGVRALDVAKRLLDYGFHAPTIYFPLSVPECLLIEPTETEDLPTLDAFVAAMAAIYQEIVSDAERVKQAPHDQIVSRIDEVQAAKCLHVADLPEAR